MNSRPLTPVTRVGLGRGRERGGEVAVATQQHHHQQQQAGGWGGGVWGGQSQSQPKPLGSNLHNRRRGPEVEEEVEEGGMEWGNRRRHGRGGSGSARKRWWEVKSQEVGKTADAEQHPQVGKTAEMDAGRVHQVAHELYPRHCGGMRRDRREEGEQRTAMARAFHQPPPVQRPWGSSLHAPTAQGARLPCSSRSCCVALGLTSPQP